MLEFLPENVTKETLPELGEVRLRNLPSSELGTVGLRAVCSVFSFTPFILISKLDVPRNERKAKAFY